MFPVALTLGMVGDDLGAGTIPLGAIVFDELAKLTTEQIHAQNTARRGVDVKMKEKQNAMRKRRDRVILTTLLLRTRR